MTEWKQNLFHEPEVPVILLSTKYHKHLGIIETIDPGSITCDFNMASGQEIAFDVHRELDGCKCTLWNFIEDLKYIYIPDYQEYYEITVSMEEDQNRVKHVVGRSACETELSQRLLRSFECNTEADILREDYIPTVFYRPQKESASLLHRILRDKCPDYTIAHVDAALADIQRSFSCDGTSIYDFLTGEVAEEIGCLFRFDSAARSISVYDLQDSCNACHYRGEFTDCCPECGSHDIRTGSGTSAGVFISSENLADLLTLEGDSDSVKNCFKIEGGDELMTATVANCNPNGSEYIYAFSEQTMEDMPEELTKRLESYYQLYEEKQADYVQYTKQLYEAIDEELYLISGMMPAVTPPDTSASQELTALYNSLSSVSVQNITTISKTSADLAVNAMAKALVDARYKTEILSSTLSALTNGTNRTWTGAFRITSKYDEADTAESNAELSVTLTGNQYEEYLRQKIQKALNREDTLFLSVFEIEELEDFKNALKDYCLDRLKSFESSYQTCIEVLIEQGVTDQNAVFYDTDLYHTLYLPYYNRVAAIREELTLREASIATVQEQNRQCTKLRDDIRKQLDFQTYLGDELWPVFCSYVREDTYSNSNYISDGLSNTELMKRAEELFHTAQKEIRKASKPQLTLTATLENLFSMKEFTDFKDKVTLGNWIICKADDILYRLRLIHIGLNYGDLSQANLTFSNAVSIKDNVSDMSTILSQAQSMAGSFDYIAHQAGKGMEASETVQDYRKTGLDAGLYNIINCGTQDVIYDEHGISCRNYDDVLDDYLPEQLRIINNTIAFTRDSWKTVSCALGKLKYIIDGVEHENYGLNADHVIAGTIVSGQIYSGNYSSTGKQGTHINLEDGSFCFAGDRLTYTPSLGLSVTGKITATSGKIGNWNIQKALYSGTSSMSSTTAGVYMGVDGFRNYKDANHYVNIQNGVITANGATISGVIHAKGGTFSDTITCTGTIQGGTISGSTILSNDATIQGGTIGGWSILQNAIFNGTPYTGDKTGNSTGIGSYGTDWAFWAGNGKFSVRQDGTLHAENASISGAITATSGTFQNVTIQDSCTVAGQSISGTIGNRASWNGSQIQNDYIGNLNAGKLTSGTVNVDYSHGTTQITNSGLKSTGGTNSFSTLEISGSILPIYNSSSGSTATIGSSSRRFAAVYASSFNDSSSRELKTNILPKKNSECLEVLKNTDVVSYNYKTDLEDTTASIQDVLERKQQYLSTTKKEAVCNEEYDQILRGFDEEIERITALKNSIPKIRYGFIAEDAPDDITSKDKKTVDIYSSIAIAYGAIKELTEEIEELNEEITNLKTCNNK